MKISPSDGYTPSTKDVRADYSEIYEGASEHRYAKFDRWLAEVERAAAEKAWDEAMMWIYANAWVNLDSGKAPILNPYREEET